ncbi:MAG: hypothetical protein HN802_01975 [Candidatus Jacksonbacteria bacterium]|jgi:hypothetical protein|nr:hypothetical protein [Candidatus Jacksonbacteria bacterium]
MSRRFFSVTIGNRDPLLWGRRLLASGCRVSDEDIQGLLENDVELGIEPVSGAVLLEVLTPKDILGGAVFTSSICDLLAKAQDIGLRPCSAVAALQLTLDRGRHLPTTSFILGRHPMSFPAQDPFGDSFYQYVTVRYEVKTIEGRPFLGCSWCGEDIYDPLLNSDEEWLFEHPN